MWMEFVLASFGTSLAPYCDDPALCRLPDVSINRMLALGRNSYANFGFRCSYIPGQADDQVYRDEVAAKILDNLTDASAPILRRLYYEAYSPAVAKLKRKIDVPDSAQVRPALRASHRAQKATESR